MGTFITFNEYNDNEGEDWNFYLPLENNTEAILALKQKLETLEMTDEYSFGSEIPENEVDIVVKHSREGYMDFENKVTGTMDVSKFADIDNPADLNDLLYKGGIVTLFKD